MSLRTPLLQIMALIVGLIVASFLPIVGLGVVLAEVRLLLVMVLGVALVYAGVLQRRGALHTIPVVIQDAQEALLERVR